MHACSQVREPLLPSGWSCCHAANARQCYYSLAHVLMPPLNAHAGHASYPVHHMHACFPSLYLPPLPARLGDLLGSHTCLRHAALLRTASASCAAWRLLRAAPSRCPAMCMQLTCHDRVQLQQGRFAAAAAGSSNGGMPTHIPPLMKARGKCQACLDPTRAMHARTRRSRVAGAPQALLTIVWPL